MAGIQDAKQMVVSMSEHNLGMRTIKGSSNPLIKAMKKRELVIMNLLRSREKETCDICGKHPWIKQNSEGAKLCHKHAHPGLPAIVKEAPTPPRNRPCPCGSGKKFKKCCLV